eukprot:1030224-Amphidinium_carterae.1
MALVSQLLEDGPQLSLQILGSLTLASHGQLVPVTTMFTIGTGLVMLLFKALRNLLLSAMRVEAPANFLTQVASHENRSFAIPVEERVVFGLFFQMLTLVTTVAFAGALRRNDDDGDYRSWPTLIFSWWILTYLVGFAMGLRLIVWHKKYMWHMLLHEKDDGGHH